MLLLVALLAVNLALRGLGVLTSLLTHSVQLRLLGQGVDGSDILGHGLVHLVLGLGSDLLEVDACIVVVGSRRVNRKPFLVDAQ